MSFVGGDDLLLQEGPAVPGDNTIKRLLPDIQVLELKYPVVLVHKGD